jgi:hypothetical protein
VEKGECWSSTPASTGPAFMAKHIPGALYAPLNKSFNTSGGVARGRRDPAHGPDRGGGRGGGGGPGPGPDRVRQPRGLRHPGDPDPLLRPRGASETIEEIGFAEVAEWKDDVMTWWWSTSASPPSTRPVMSRAPSRPRTRASRPTSGTGGQDPPGPKLLVHCQSGGRSAAAAAFLAREGFDVKFVDGDFEAYREVWGRGHGGGRPGGLRAMALLRRLFPLATQLEGYDRSTLPVGPLGGADRGGDADPPGDGVRPDRRDAAHLRALRLPGPPGHLRLIGTSRQLAVGPWP